MPYFKRRVVRIGVVLALSLAFAHHSWAGQNVIELRVITIPLRDSNGTVMAYMTFRPDRSTRSSIVFHDAQRHLLNEIPAQLAQQPVRPSFPPLPAASPPTQRLRPPPPTERGGREDYVSNDDILQRQINTLRAELDRVTSRVNALTRR